jgi:hypothetical protein
MEQLLELVVWVVEAEILELLVQLLQDCLGTVEEMLCL